MRVTYSKATVGIVKMQSRDANFSPYGHIVMENHGVCLRIEDFSDIGKAFGITTHKLLCAGLIWFTKKNNIGDDGDNVQSEIFIPLKEYALLCGHNGIIAKDENDRDRAKESLKTVRKQISKDLKLLLHSSLEWTEATRGKKEHYECPILLNGRIRNGYIYMTFSPEFAKYLKHRRITEYPRALFSVDNRKPNAYRIGQACAFKYYNTNNKKDGNFNKFKVQTLLAYTNLPTVQTVRKEKSGSWRTRIKEPLEKALNELVAKGVISKWECKRKVNPLLEEKNHKLTFEEWSDSLIYFTCIDDVELPTVEVTVPSEPSTQIEKPSHSESTEVQEENSSESKPTEQAQENSSSESIKSTEQVPKNHYNSKKTTKNKKKSKKNHSPYRKKLEFPLLE